jgi:hypothetical protein
VANTTNQAVTWYVQEGAAGGTVTSAGAYTAPATAGTYHVVATSQADTTKYAVATVTVTAPAPVITVSVNPSAATLTAGGSASFTATVANTTNQGVTWSVQEGAAGGTVTSAGAYTAPATAGTYHVVATSLADTTKGGVATITVTAPPPVAVSVTPSSASIAAGATLTFSATVSNSSNQGVTWSVPEGASGGNITSAGVYTAPSTAGTYHVVATSSADPSKTATAPVTVSATTSTPPPSSAPDCASAPLRSTGTVHYFCSNGGSDSNDGLSPSTPKASWSAAVTTFNSMPAGDTVALCRGGSWSVSTTDAAPSASCTATNTCDFRDYGSGVRPIVNFTATGTAIGLFTLRNKQGVRFWNLDVRLVDGVGAQQIGWVVDYGVTDIDICNVAVSGGLRHFDQEYWTGTTRANRLTIRNSTFTHALHHSILAASSNLTIDSNVFLNNGVSSTCPQGTFYCHTVYITDESPGGASETNTMETQNIHITNNSMTLDSTHDCGSVLIHVGGRHNNMAIENNYISAALNAASGGSCTGFGAGENNYSTQVAGGLSSWQRHLVVRRNRISMPNPNNQGQTPIQVDGTGTTARCGTVPVGQQCPGQSAYKAGDAVAPSIISDNVISVMNDSAIHVKAHPNPSTNPGDLTSGVLVYNNSLYVFNPAGAANTLNIDNEGSGYVVQNNAVYIANNDSAQCMGAPSSGSPFFLRNSNNYCRTGTNGGLGQMSGTWGTSASSGSIWTNASAGDFTLPAGSPLIGAGNSTYYSPTAIGSATWSAKDTGLARTVPDDIGAMKK